MLPAGCVPIAPGTGQETPPFVKKDTYRINQVSRQRLCDRRDRDGRNGHRNYVKTAGGEVWVLQEWIPALNIKFLL